MQKSLSSHEDLESAAKLFIKNRDKKPGGVFLHAVHRLDKPVSGIALFAKTKKALTRLNESIRKGLFKKTYYAALEGTLNEEGTLEHYLFHGDFRAIVSTSPKEGYKKAILNYKVLKTTLTKTLVEIDLISGRYHQIRAQFSHISHPVVFDEKYGSKTTGDYEGILLHHGKLTFPHPVKEEMMTIESELPREFMRTQVLTKI